MNDTGFGWFIGAMCTAVACVLGFFGYLFVRVDHAADAAQARYQTYIATPMVVECTSGATTLKSQVAKGWSLSGDSRMLPHYYTINGDVFVPPPGYSCHIERATA